MSIIKNNRKKRILACAVLTLLIFSMQVFGQSANTSLGGTIQDATEGYLPGVTITATNVATGVETTTLSNDSGAFNFPSLQPGIYKVSAELDGFQTNTKTDVTLGSGGQVRLNFELAVAQINEEIEVVTTAQDILTESSSSTGTVLRSQQLIDLPLTSNDVMELVNIMGGVMPSQGVADEFDSRRTDQSFAGVNANAIHIQQDGVTINDVRYNTGIASSSRINTEMVSEFKLILSPVDAEMGRGMGQVQIMTKSGANAYHGSGVWNINNSALDANTWSNNRTGLQLEWRNLNTYTLSFSGPIKKNKTFFFLTWDHAIPRTHSNRAPQVLTNCARKGIFRYFDGWNSTRYDSQTAWTGFTRTNGVITGLTAGALQARPVVDMNGFPLDQQLADSMDYEFAGLVEDLVEPITGTPAQYVSGGSYAGGSGLRYVNVFGPLDPNSQAVADIEADLVNCNEYTPDYANYIMDDPSTTGVNESKSAQSYEALGITRYWEERASGTGTVYRNQDTLAIPNFTAYMPDANSWHLTPTGSSAAVDGLNFATHAWTRADKGVDRIYGVGQDNARKNITIKIDHNFNDRHRASGTYTYERDINAGAQKLWPNGFEGTTERYPQRFSISLTSSLRPTLLNEGRFGLNNNKAHSLNAVDATATKDEIQALMQSMMPTNTWENYPQGEPFVFNPQRFWTNNYMSHFIGGATQAWVWHSYLPSYGGYDHRWTISDTLTWTKGRHSLKFGGDIRLTRSHQDADGDAGLLLSRPSMPTAFGGIQSYSTPADIIGTDNVSQIPGLVGVNSFYPWAGTVLNWSTGTLRQMQDLRDYQAGSMSHIWQWFFVNSPEATDWNDINNGETTRIIDIRQKELSFFAKDDWKVSNSLTLNLGLRYEYYGVPWMDKGMTLALEGGSNSLFGVTGRDFSTWMAEHPVNLGAEYYTTQGFIGPGSPNPGVTVFNKDKNNFGPAIGFAWQLPWFGKGKTTLRGGYQLSYAQIANADSVSGGFADLLAGSTGTNFDFYYYGSVDQPYMRFADVDSYLPTKKYIETATNPVLPLHTLDIVNREADLSVYDQNVVNPYTQSLNLSITRNLSSNVTLDVRYIGTLARKQISNLNLNAANWLNNGLKEALDEARRGGNPELLNKMFMGTQWNITALGTQNRIAVGATNGPTGAEIVRQTYATSLSAGDYNSIATALNTLNYTKGGVYNLNAGLPTLGTLEKGSVMRHANTLYAGEFPENFIVANPQLGAANWYTNLNHNNYHSMQVQLTVRPTYDFNMTGTYTWSKNLGNSSYTDPNDRTNPFDYTWTGNSRTHQLNTYGAWTLPFGANGFLFRDVSNPIVRRLIEGWNLSWIFSLNSGSRSNVSANQTHLYANSVPNLIRPDLLDLSSGHVYWEPGAGTGYYYGDPDQYMLGPDLQCYDVNLVSYKYNTVQVAPGIFQQEEIANTSLRDNCITNMGAMYFPMTETVTEWYKPVAPETGANAYGYKSRQVVKNVYSAANVIMQQPLPGEYGTLGRNKAEGPGSFSLDMAMGKTVELTEGKSIGFRVDASNILNHPSPGGGSTSVGTTGDFGLISSKSGNRSFQAKITLRF